MDKRRSFEFRMSKKVAELTQVVHMLFTRNHEKEVEIETLREAYELEIQNILQDAQKRLMVLNDELQQRGKADDKESQIRQQLETSFKAKEAELHRKLAETERSLADERQECQNIRDLLINAQKDIEQLRNGVAEELNLKSDEISKRDKEIDRLRKQVAVYEKSLKESEKETNSAVRDFEKSNERLENELTHMNELLRESQDVKEQLMTRIRTLETELKALKKDFNRRLAESVANQVNRIPRSTATFTDHNEELERLRREIQRYRLELSNRDSNFNRVFSSQQPMIVDNRASKSVTIQSQQPSIPFSRSPVSASQSHQGPVLQNGIGKPVNVNGFVKSNPRNPRSSASPKAGRPNFSSNVNAFYEEMQPTPRPNSAASQLPSISSTSSSADGRSRSQRFTKPRPLPKEMLSTK